MKRTKSYPLYRFIKFWVRTFYPKTEVVGLENLPEGPALVVGNHSQMHGPIACELYFPAPRRTWCAGQMLHLKEVPDYAFTDFWSGKPKTVRWFYRLLSYIIAPFSVCVFNNADTIGVYRDNRVLSTFKNTVSALQAGDRVVIFPECNQAHNAIVHQFQENFVDVAKLYYKRTGACLPFVPLYLCPALKKMYIGKPVYYDPALPMEQQRHEICVSLMDAITRMAQALPPHRVVPYPNIPKKDYPMSTDGEGSL